MQEAAFVVKGPRVCGERSREGYESMCMDGRAKVDEGMQLLRVRSGSST